MRQTTKLKQLLHAPKLLQAPGAYDVLSARIIAMAGFETVYMTGYGTSASVIGQPDVGFLTATEMAEQARHIVSAVDVPVIADGDTGFGNPMNVVRTVRLYEQAGASGIQLEDQAFPKRCGHMLGRRVIPMEEMVQKIKAAVDTRRDGTSSSSPARMRAPTTGSTRLCGAARPTGKQAPTCSLSRARKVWTSSSGSGRLSPARRCWPT